jgi:hypothetical protein
MVRKEIFAGFMEEEVLLSLGYVLKTHGKLYQLQILGPTPRPLLGSMCPCLGRIGPLNQG